VQPATVVEDLDELEDRSARGCPSRESLAVDELLLERGEEALGERIVRALAGSRERLGETVGIEDRPGPALAAAIGVDDEPRRWVTQLQGHGEGVAAEGAPHVVGHREATTRRLARSIVVARFRQPSWVRM
jgi:hypothetical protein